MAILEKGLFTSSMYTIHIEVIKKMSFVLAVVANTDLIKLPCVQDMQDDTMTKDTECPRAMVRSISMIRHSPRQL